MKLGDNDEILVSGPNIFPEYWNRRSNCRGAARRVVSHRGSGRSECVGNVADRGADQESDCVGVGHKFHRNQSRTRLPNCCRKRSRLLWLGTGADICRTGDGSVTAEKVQAALDAVNPDCRTTSRCARSV